MQPNKLIQETSPYLLQHAYNPVAWYPWGEEALQLAKKEDKPILVSIGYSACHWCHVMERESFENEEIAKLMNEHFVNIKIDREERPDLDHIYMDAVQAISGSSGWPLNVFLTPDCKPFYGGTYFPPVRAYNRASWKEILLAIADIFQNKRSEVETKADELIQFISKGSSSFIRTNISGMHTSAEGDAGMIFKNLMQNADKVWGGFGNAPKFPQTFSINFLLRYYHYTGNTEALQHACLSLDKMLQGGLYDQIGGGFARYSTDAQWLVPHFEKMLYDNALLVISLGDAYRITGNIIYKEALKQTVDFLLREMKNAEGGFYAALDADSEGEEGKFYVWSYDEVVEVLKEDADVFCSFYNILPDGNWEHQNILHIKEPLKVFASQNGYNEENLRNLILRCSQSLLQKRSQRIRPATDDKILSGWNCLVVKALCNAGSVLQNRDYIIEAVTLFEFLQEKFRATSDTSHYFHTYKNGNASQPAFLDDYAYMINAALSLSEITSDLSYITLAEELTEYLLINFSDNSDPFFFYTASGQEDIIVRKKELYDGAIPSGNAVMVENLVQLSVILNKPEWKNHAEKMIDLIRESILKYPSSFGYYASLLIENSNTFKEIVITGPDYEKNRDELLKYFIPGKIFLSAPAPQKKYLLLNKELISENWFYLCRNFSCEKPEKDFDQFVKNLLRTEGV